MLNCLPKVVVGGEGALGVATPVMTGLCSLCSGGTKAFCLRRRLPYDVDDSLLQLSSLEMARSNAVEKDGGVPQRHLRKLPQVSKRRWPTPARTARTRPFIYTHITHHLRWSNHLLAFRSMSLD